MSNFDPVKGIGDYLAELGEELRRLREFFAAYEDMDRKDGEPHREIGEYTPRSDSRRRARHHLCLAPQADRPLRVLFRPPGHGLERPMVPVEMAARTQDH